MLHVVTSAAAMLIIGLVAIVAGVYALLRRLSRNRDDGVWSIGKLTPAGCFILAFTLPRRTSSSRVWA